MLMLLFYTFTSVIFRTAGQGFINHVTHENAERFCDALGSNLLTYDQVAASSKPSSLKLLDDGQSAWIEGRATFSPFMSLLGCFKINSAVKHKYMLEENNLFLCIEKCRMDYFIAGVSGRKCFCFADSKFKLSIADSFDCDINCSDHTLDSCGGKLAMSVYRFDYSYGSDWARNQPSLKQCVYIASRNGTLRLYTHNCYSLQNVSVDGYFCQRHTAWTSLDRCIHDKNMCLIEEEGSWKKAKDKCINREGFLSADIWSSRFRSMIGTNKTYWLGIYRTFHPTAKKMNSVNKAACMAVTRLRNSYFVEAESCFTKKYFLCEQTSNLVTNRSVSSKADSISSFKCSDEKNNDLNKSQSINGVKYAFGFNTSEVRYSAERLIAYTLPGIIVICNLILIVSFLIYRRFKNNKGNNIHRVATSEPHLAEIRTDNSEENPTNHERHIYSSVSDQQANTEHGQHVYNSVIDQAQIERGQHVYTSVSDQTQTEQEQFISVNGRSQTEREQHLYTSVSDNTLTEHEQPMSHPVRDGTQIEKGQYDNTSVSDKNQTEHTQHIYTSVIDQLRHALKNKESDMGNTNPNHAEHKRHNYTSVDGQTVQVYEHVNQDGSINLYDDLYLQSTRDNSLQSHTFPLQAGKDHTHNAEFHQLNGCQDAAKGKSLGNYESLMPRTASEEYAHALPRALAKSSNWW